MKNKIIYAVALSFLVFVIAVLAQIKIPHDLSPPKLPDQPKAPEPTGPGAQAATATPTPRQ